MKTPAKFKEYIWLVNVIRNAGSISFAEIQEKWLETEMSGGVELARSTFNRHKDAIEDIFGIYIDCNRRNGYRYRIGNEEVFADSSVQNWMLSTLSVNNTLSESLSLQDRILLEQVHTKPELFSTIVDAMRRSLCITITYRRYAAEAQLATFAPYCVKLFKSRWYVLGYFDRMGYGGGKGFFALYSFDRILDIEITDQKFVMDNEFSAKHYFSEHYGVLTAADVPVERIVLRAYSYERYYLRDLPIHPSQREIEKGDDYSDFELYMRPTIDFVGHLMSRGINIKVLAPASLAAQVADYHLQAAQLYQK
ncbi:MAG: WYL domain-containing protein [Bacteroidales bacterium]|nr:WYL domain-containing protein [Bacteroidales bacterium]